VEESPSRCPTNNAEHSYGIVGWIQDDSWSCQADFGLIGNVVFMSRICSILAAAEITVAS